MTHDVKAVIPAALVFAGLLYAGYKIGGLAGELQTVNRTTSTGVLGALLGGNSR